jgi:hypothetical protein
MGRLTGYLQDQFRLLAPTGWEGGREQHLLLPELASILDYAPRADVILTNQSEERRLWIEFEVSRADPVANHAKFATAHLFQPQLPGDVFVAMISRHVDRGRRNLAANTVHLMRRIGMNAVQTVLFPDLIGSEVQRFNHMTHDELRASGPDVRPEVERVLAVTTPQGSVGNHRIYFAGEIVDVLLNARAWNEGVKTPGGRTLWGRRRVRYFVYVPYSRAFAPCKFCAFLPIRQPGASDGLTDFSRMTLEFYAELDEREPRFDGNRAQTHLIRRLGMIPRSPDQAPELADHFQHWLASVADLIVVDQDGPIWLCPPDN